MFIFRKLVPLAATGALLVAGAPTAYAVELPRETIDAPADLELTAVQTSPGPGARLELGQAVEFTVELTNNGPNTAGFALVDFTSPEGAINWTPPTGGDSLCNLLDSSMECYARDLGAGEVTTFTVQGTVTPNAADLLPDGGNRFATWAVGAHFEAENTAHNVDPELTNNQVVGSWDVNADTRVAADLELTTIRTNPRSGNTLQLGQSVEFTVRLMNNGPREAAVAYVDFSSQNGSYAWTSPYNASSPCKVSNSTMVCTARALASGASTNFTVKGTVTKDPKHLLQRSNYRYATWGARARFNADNPAQNYDPNTSNNSVSGRWTVNTRAVDLRVQTISTSPTAGARLTPGQQIEFKVKLTNSGPSAADLAYVDFTSQNGAIIWTPPTGVGSLCSVQTTGNVAGTIMVCTARSLAAGASANFTAKGTVTKDPNQLAPYRNSRYVSWAARARLDVNNGGRSYDLDTRNNSIGGNWLVETRPPVPPGADLAVRIAAIKPTSEEKLTLGAPIEVTVELTNRGPKVANLAYVDLVSPGEAIIWTPPTGVGSPCSVPSSNLPSTGNPAGTTMVCTARSLAAGASATFTVKGTITKELNHLTRQWNTNYATWTATARLDADDRARTPDPDPRNNAVSGRWVVAANRPQPTRRTAPAKTPNPTRFRPPSTELAVN